MVTVLSRESLLTDRVRRLKDRLLTEPYYASGERLRFLLEVYRDNDADPEVIKRAKVFEKTLDGMSIFIDENPIAGTITKYFKGVNPFPEFACRWMLKEGGGSHGTLGKITPDEEFMSLIKEVVNHWNGRCTWDRSVKAIRSAHPEIDPVKWMKRGVESFAPPAHGPNFGIIDWPLVLNKGLKAVIEEAEQVKAGLPLGDQASQDKRDFLSAVVIALNAIIKFAERYSRLAREMAQEETNPDRKAELERIGEMCEWVPANPARDFREAVQSFWLVYAMAWLEGYHASTPGRFPQYMYPFYAKDKEAGRISEEEGIELLELLFLKMAAVQDYLSEDMFTTNQASVSQILSLGGLTPDGEDATNELDFLILEAEDRIALVEPNLAVLYHDKMSEKFLMKCVEVIRNTGLGMPQFHNARVFVERALHWYDGISLEEARDVCCFGCQDMVVPGKTYFPVETIINSAKMLELALNNGVDPLSGEQVGPKTGNAEGFKTFDELGKAVREQLKYFLPISVSFTQVGFSYIAKYMPYVVQSALTGDCIQRGIDVMSGGAKYNVGGCVFVGTVDLTNSLAAIKKLVFEEKRISMRELLDALKADFEGKEEIHRMLLEAPKYGNDDDYVDEITRQWFAILAEEHSKLAPFPRVAGAKPRPEAYSPSFHFHRGLLTGALPCGRKARLPLTDASVAPMPGTDKNGPTALARSAARALDTVEWGSNHLNMKFLPSVLQDKVGVRNLLNLIKTYMDLGGSHIQFNCVSNKTLRDAQAHPEQYRHLAVRVAGFSAYFVELSKPVQDEIIKRTELAGF